MPIRKEFRRFYQKEWRAYRRRLIELHGAKCMNCGRPAPRYLAAAHVSHDPRSSEVRLWCTSCHSRHDARHTYAMRRRLHAARYGQLWLWPELQWEPYPEWLRPRARRRADDDGRLF
jgi:5-methylcytosine-specific restriction endonuclease McrA